jgi:hypothetical protein
LTLKLVGEANALGLWSISLEYTGSIEGRVANLSELLKTEQLYSPYDNHPAHEPDRLQYDILKKVDDQFESDSFRSDLHEYFASSVPITQEVYVDTVARRLVIPIFWQVLRTKKNSELHVDFTAESKNGYIYLNPAGPIHGDPWEGFVECVVIFFRYPDVGDTDKYVDAIADKLQPGLIDSLDVFMADYKREMYPEMSEGTALSP